MTQKSIPPQDSSSTNRPSRLTAALHSSEKFTAITMNFYQALLCDLWVKNKNNIVPKATTQDIYSTESKIYEHSPEHFDEYFLGSIGMINAVRDTFNRSIPEGSVSEDKFNKLFKLLGDMDLPNIIIENIE